MKHMLIKAVGLVAVTAMSGCATVYRVSESAPEPPPAPASGSTAMRNPAVSVKVVSADGSAKNLASTVRSATEGMLASRGFDVVSKRPADSIVSIAVSRRESARLSDWRVYEGTADARISEAASGRLVASSEFKATGERALDESKAEASLKDRLVQQIAAWLSTTLPCRKVPLPPGAAPHGRAMLTIMPKDQSGKPLDALRVQRRFMDAVAAHPGVVSCVLVGEDPPRCAFTFSVVYEPQAFPGGLLNTIVLDRPDLGGNVELEIAR